MSFLSFVSFREVVHFVFLALGRAELAVSVSLLLAKLTVGYMFTFTEMLLEICGINHLI